LRDLAQSELKNPDDTDQQTAIADGWLEQAARVPAFALAMQVHAYDWNVRALPNATIASQRKHVEEQLADLIPLISDRRELAAMWLKLGDALSQRAYDPSRISGGMAADDTFQDVPQQGGLLVGFHVGLAMLKDKQVITYFQPVYLTPNGEIDGPGFGRAYSKLRTVHAPKGYAIGKMDVCGDAGVNSITPTFMRIDGDHLNMDDARKGEFVGGVGGTLEVLDGRGTPVVGVCGRQKDGFIGLGLVYSQPVDDVSTQRR
jgi:hypothetical protein